MSDFCTNCGSEISSGNNFCAKCGTKAIANNQPKNKSNMGTVTKIIIGIAIIIVLIIVALVVLAVSIASSFVAEQSQLTSSMPLGEPETKPEGFELTTSQKNQIRAIEVGCDDQIAMASLYGESTENLVAQRCAEHLQNTLAGFENQWKVDQAILNHDPEKCEETTNPTGCIMKYVKENNEPEACELLDTNTSCLSNYASRTENPNMCLQADNITECVENIFLKFGSETCQILNEDEVTDCKINYIIRKHESGTSPKQTEVSTKSTKSCTPDYRYKFDYIPNRITCALKSLNQGLFSGEELFSIENEGELFVCTIVSEWKQTNPVDEFCIAVKAAYTENMSLCGMISGKAQKECYLHFALHDDMFTMNDCETYAKEEYSLTCTYLVAARTQDMAFCEAIHLNKGDPNRMGCKSKVVTYKMWLDGEI